MATSTTSTVIGIGKRTFYTQTGQTWIVGTRLRAKVVGRDDTHWVEGFVTLYQSGGAAPYVNIQVDAKLGSGTFANWTIDEAPITSAIPLGSPYLRSGGTTWSGKRDEEGHREYTIKYLVLCNSRDGPANVLNTPGLPRPGSRWLIDNDKDVWAFALWNATVTPVMKRGPNTAFEVEIPFSTKLPGKACKDRQFENPLLEPPKISGGFNKYREEATKDRFGEPIVNSAHEQLRGPTNEWEAGRPTVSIELNVAKLDLTLLLSMAGTVNDAPLWGFGRRCVFLQHPSWERKFYGQCFPYYTLKLEFEINPNTWDRDLLDDGTKVLNGRWNNSTGRWQTLAIAGFTGAVNPDPLNPSHFIKFKDRASNYTRVILDGAGKPYDPTPITTTTLCEVCEDGMPASWDVLGLELALPGVTVGVTHTAACTWQRTIPPNTFTLSGVRVGADLTQWTLTVKATGAAVDTASWKANIVDDDATACYGPWTLDKVGGDNAWPDAVFIKIDRSVPGSIHVEKFEESHFPLITGLPLRLT